MRTFQRVSRLIHPWLALPMLAGLALGVLLAIGLGCINFNKEPPATAAPAINPQLPDVPVPWGFKFSNDKSRESVQGTVRRVEHYYEGDSPMGQVSAFYRRLMPTFGWSPIEENLSGGVQRFTFEKGNDFCYVSVWDSWGTKLLIQVMPKGVKPATAAGKAPPVRSAGK
jgi:hypothetical protein